MDVKSETIQARIDLLKEQRQLFVTQANTQVALFDGAIAELEALLKPPAKEKAPDEADRG